ncbi:hypothetical protein SO802_011657 [Lithocarpus litseifolius]|uniref:Uncharacterized protein n=1 Tax=Lithocarpus litseifolius TaxID=425828 RepID=A0AAW2D4H2_9ROSI
MSLLGWRCGGALLKLNTIASSSSATASASTTSSSLLNLIRHNSKRCLSFASNHEEEKNSHSQCPHQHSSSSNKARILVRGRSRGDKESMKRLEITGLPHWSEPVHCKLVGITFDDERGISSTLADANDILDTNLDIVYSKKTGYLSRCSRSVGYPRFFQRDKLVTKSQASSIALATSEASDILSG